MPAGRREASAARGIADQDPVGGTQAGAGVPLPVHERFHQCGPIAVAPLEVPRQLAQDHAEDLGGEAAALHGGADEKATETEHAVQPLATQLGRPADPLVAGGDRQGRGGEAERPQQAVLGLDQVAQLRAHVQHRALRVLAGDDLVPRTAL